MQSEGAVFAAAVDPWAWSLDAVLTLLSAVGSFAVAVVAVVVTVRLAKGDRANRERQARAEFLGLIDVGIATGDQNALQDAAARIADAQPVADWIGSEIATLNILRTEPRESWPAWHHENMIRERVRRWVESGGEFDDTTLDAESN